MYKVLIAEDEPFIGDSIRKMMERFGPEFEVCACVYDGEAALERLEEESFDVVLTDIRMPGMDGIEVLRRIDRDYPNIITVVISGYEIFDYARKALKYHASEYLLKPVSIDNMKELLAKLKVLLVEREKEQHYQKIFSAVGVGGGEKKRRRQRERAVGGVRKAISGGSLWGKDYNKRVVKKVWFGSLLSQYIISPGAGNVAFRLFEQAAN